MKTLKLLPILLIIFTSFNSFGQSWKYKSLSIGLNTPANSHVMYIDVSQSGKNNIELISLNRTTDGYTFYKVTVEDPNSGYLYELTEEPFTRKKIHLNPGRYKVVLYGKTWTTKLGRASRYDASKEGSGSIRIGWYGK